LLSLSGERCYHARKNSVERKRPLKIACNVGGLDRGTRIALGAALVLISYLGMLPKAWLTELGYAGGLILFATGVIGWCPLNQLLGINTCGNK